MANASPVKDRPERKEPTLSGRNERIEVYFHFDRISLRRQPESGGNSQDVGVHGQSRLTERDRADDVRGLASDPRDGHEVCHAMWHLAVEPLDQRARHADETPRLVAKEPGGPHDLFELGGIRVSEVAGRRVPAE